ncbi:hypothetical protein [Streptomyces longispororuber]|uniref:hypothetical protein n=1 Tax=Streptomyces longispororuber TaxID=68230 RepID=UPI0036FD7055
MASIQPVTIYPPDAEGGRRVRVDGTILGRANSTRDVAVFLQRAGLEGWDDVDVLHTAMIEWRGGGPDVWEAPDQP